jgi:23S rRNA (pseudouridine1915-N3)-methyltransferase
MQRIAVFVRIQAGLAVRIAQAPIHPMHIRLIVAGKPALAYAKAGVDEYLKRLSRFGGYEIVIVKAGTRDEVSARLLEKSHGCHRIALDERGESLGTRSFAEKLDALAMRGDIKTVAFLIGAADGHNEALRNACDGILTLSPFTLQHELALLILLEQLYRVTSLKSGSPYHRD